jgi:hypothetical protein
MNRIPHCDDEIIQSALNVPRIADIPGHPSEDN